MLEFNYNIQDKLGIHARPAGVLSKKAKEFTSTITISANGKRAELKKLLAVMMLGVKTETTIQVVFQGEDEQEAYQAITQLIQELL